jgi:hypothetical protein
MDGKNHPRENTQEITSFFNFTIQNHYGFIIARLLEVGADQSLKNSQGLNAADFAKKKVQETLFTQMLMDLESEDARRVFNILDKINFVPKQSSLTRTLLPHPSTLKQEILSQRSEDILETVTPVEQKQPQVDAPAPSKESSNTIIIEDYFLQSLPPKDIQN